MYSAWAKKNFRRSPDKAAYALLKENSGSSACAKHRAFSYLSLLCKTTS